MADQKNERPRKGHPTYRCARCGDMFVSLDFESDVMALKHLMSGPMVMEANGVSRHAFHGCPDGGVGVGHIIGLTPTDKIQKAIVDKTRTAN